MPIRPRKVTHPIGSCDDEVWVAEGLDDALLGYGEQAGKTVAVYNREKCLEIFMERDGMSREDADEHMSYNVAGTYLPGQIPTFLDLFRATKTEFATQEHDSRRPAGWA
mgnify:CR=1 FL=1